MPGVGGESVIYTFTSGHRVRLRRRGLISILVIFPSSSQDVLLFWQNRSLWYSYSDSSQNKRDTNSKTKTLNSPSRNTRYAAGAGSG